ncbi:MAG: N-acetyltransferase [Leptospiraceae bacterium]|nr:N-acetyltransferase [Leptospiraceae bacterium]
MENAYIDKAAHVDERSRIGDGTRVWINAQIRENVTIGKNCSISKDVYIDKNVTIGDNCKIQNGVSIYDGVTIENDVFIGPNVTFTNDKLPRAFNADWKISKTIIRNGASIGANSTLVCGTTIGEYAMVGAGSVVTKDVEPYSMVIGNPARHRYYVDREGKKVER